MSTQAFGFDFSLILFRNIYFRHLQSFENHSDISKTSPFTQRSPQLKIPVVSLYLSPTTYRSVSGYFRYDTRYMAHNNSLPGNSHQENASVLSSFDLLLHEKHRPLQRPSGQRKTVLLWSYFVKLLQMCLSTAALAHSEI